LIAAATAIPSALVATDTGTGFGVDAFDRVDVARKIGAAWSTFSKVAAAKCRAEGVAPP
jgi:hypothetical protein